MTIETLARVSEGVERPSRPARNVSTSAAAEYLGLAGSYLIKLRNNGNGPAFYKFGSRVVYRTEDLDEWMAQHRRRSTADRGAGK